VLPQKKREEADDQTSAANCLKKHNHVGPPPCRFDAVEGKADQVKGKVQNTVGGMKDALRDDE
jgi:hypothetical protein